MTHSALALSPRAVGAPNTLVSLNEEEMLHIAGGLALIGGVLLSGCLIAGGIILVAAAAAVIGAAVYVATHD